jgi:hypothetical protein
MVTESPETVKRLCRVSDALAPRYGHLAFEIALSLRLGGADHWLHLRSVVVSTRAKHHGPQSYPINVRTVYSQKCQLGH